MLDMHVCVVCESKGTCMCTNGGGGRGGVVERRTRAREREREMRCWLIVITSIFLPCKKLATPARGKGRTKLTAAQRA